MIFAITKEAKVFFASLDMTFDKTPLVQLDITPVIYILTLSYQSLRSRKVSLKKYLLDLIFVFAEYDAADGYLAEVDCSILSLVGCASEGSITILYPFLRLGDITIQFTLIFGGL